MKKNIDSRNIKIIMLLNQVQHKIKSTILIISVIFKQPRINKRIYKLIEGLYDSNVYDVNNTVFMLVF